ncbi:MAG: hypothetical protein KJ749_05410, partial [Planctomycetes bacterium]|nr:hypothetical protein [Planctomycetota bacterium]
VYREAANLTFILEVAQEPTGTYRIHTVHRPDFVWFRVEEDGKPIYEAWATDVDAFLPAGQSAGIWLVVDKNYTVGGAMTAFRVEEERFYRGWGSENDANFIPCFSHVINRPIVGPRSNMVWLIDDLLGTREDLLPDREYMEPSKYIPLLHERGYVGPDFPIGRILHVWRRPAGRAFLGNTGTDIVTLCMKDSEWAVLRRMTMLGNDVTVKDSWKVDPKNGLIVQWDRDFGQDISAGRIRTLKFVYQADGGLGVKLMKGDLSSKP